jgi:hypothetical protein
VNLLPLVGLITGFVLRDRRAVIVTAALAGIGLILVALLTDEIDGWGDAYVWIVLIVSLLASLLGIWLGRVFAARRLARRRS